MIRQPVLLTVGTSIHIMLIDFDTVFVDIVGVMSRDSAFRDLAAFGSACLALGDDDA
jgi:hypothetical protein